MSNELLLLIGKALLTLLFSGITYYIGHSFGKIVKLSITKEGTKAEPWGTVMLVTVLVLPLCFTWLLFHSVETTGLITLIVGASHHFAFRRALKSTQTEQ